MNMPATDRTAARAELTDGVAAARRLSLARRVSLATGMAALASAGLVACSDTTGSPLGETQWQVSQIFDGTDRPVHLPDSQQGRAFIVIGQDSLTGISGCLSIQADVQWNGDQSEITVSRYRTQPMEGSRPCNPGDEDTAQRLGAVLNDRRLAIQRPDETSMKLQRTGDNLGQWQTAPFAEFISGPTGG